MSSPLRNTHSDNVFDVINTIIMCLIFLIIVYPLYFILIASFSDPNLVNAGQVIFWPKGLMLDGYQRIFSMPKVWIGYRNTIYYTTVGCLISVSCTITGGYALSHKSLPGSNFFMGMLTFTMFFNGGMIPTYLLVKNLDLLDSLV